MKKLFVAAALCVASLGAWAQSEIEGLTFSTWTDSGYYRGPGFPLDGYVVVGQSAQVGRGFTGGQFTSIRSEFNLAGQQAASSALLTFEFEGRYAIASQPQTPQLPVFIGSYAGDNVANVSDWKSLIVGPFSPILAGPTQFGMFDAAAFAVGQSLSFDVTSIFNAALARGDAALGIGLDSGALYQYARYGDFTLTVSAVPEPSTYALMLAGLALVGSAARRHRARSLGGN